MNLIQKLCHLYKSNTRLPQHEARKLYEKGAITWKEVQNLCIEWSTDLSERKVYFVCPKCFAPMRHCPDPACSEEGVGHHLLEEDGKGCDEDIKYKDALLFYETDAPNHSYFVDNKDVEKLKQELIEVFAKFGVEFSGEIQGAIQLKNTEDSKVGLYLRF